MVLLEADPVTLVDCGPNTEATRQALEEGLFSRGLSVADIKVLVLTHPHVDHIGLAGWIKEQSGAIIMAHPKSAATIAGADTDMRKEFAEVFFRRCGVPDEAIAMVREVYRSLKKLERPAEVDEMLEDREGLILGGRAWRVFGTPGHTTGCVCLKSPNDKVLISGDHLIGHISSNPVLEPESPGSLKPFRSLPAYLKSLRRTAKLDLQLVIPGHGDLITDHRAVISNRLEMHARRKSQIASFLQDQARSAYEICGLLYPGLEYRQLYLGVSEIVGHLHLLEDDGALEVTQKAGVDYYRLEGVRG